ncbi:MAG: CpsB/CapC family capsule biosynthesis tyrosine phosphatase [Chitinophagaceae bacterium]
MDIHSHLLPGIDDGARNIDESVQLIKAMMKLGFSKN